jgi:hypothetical protein
LDNNGLSFHDAAASALDYQAVSVLLRNNSVSVEVNGMIFLSINASSCNFLQYCIFVSMCFEMLCSIEYSTYYKNNFQVPIQVPSSSDLESILSPDPVCSDLQLKEINYNAAGNTA